MKLLVSIKLQLCLVSALLPLLTSGQNVGSFGQTENDAGQFGQRTLSREGKSLLNTFPFNAGQNGGGHDHGHEHEHANHAHPEHDHDHDDGRLARQGASDNEVALDIGSIAAAGERCIDKVVMVQETEYDDVIECKHSYSERCHTTYTTDYQPQQEEECEENFKKKCFIEFKNVAFDEKVQFCYTPLVRNCDIPGPTECKTEYRSECTTRYHEHDVEDDVADCTEETEKKCDQVTQGYTTEEKCSTWPTQRCSLQKQKVKKYSPETECKKVPFELCGPAGCPVEPGQEQCQEKKETVVQEVPEENCSLEPQVECKFVTKLVPLLKPAENCIDIPKEVCSRTRRNPRKVSKPVIKKWCYTPTKESGLPPPPPRPTPPPPTRPPPPPTRRPGDDIGNNINNQGSRPPPTRTEPPPTETGCAAGYPVDHCPRRGGDRRCDEECNTPACNFDGGDCRVPPPTPRPPPPPPPTRPTPPPVRTPPPPSGCAPNFPADYCESKSGNRRCDFECNIPACNYDGGDCTPPPPTQPPNSYLPPRQGY